MCSQIPKDGPVMEVGFWDRGSDFRLMSNINVTLQNRCFRSLAVSGTTHKARLFGQHYGVTRDFMQCFRMACDPELKFGSGLAADKLVRTEN